VLHGFLPERPAGATQRTAWHGDRLQDALPCLPRGFGLRWIEDQRAGVLSEPPPGSARPEACAAFVALPLLAVAVSAWRTVGPGAGERVLLCGHGLQLHAVAQGPAAAGWLASMRLDADPAAEQGPRVTPLSDVTLRDVRVRGGYREDPPAQRLALVLGVTALQEPQHALPLGAGAAWPALQGRPVFAAGVPTAGTCRELLAARCSARHLERGTRAAADRVDIWVHDGPRPDWHASALPDWIVSRRRFRSFCFFVFFVCFTTPTHTKQTQRTTLD